jgi:hypothetical protein
MWCRSYRDHVIMAFPSFDTATGLWAPQANISWVTGPVRKSEFVRFSKRVISEGEAVTCASRAARAWINKRLKDLHNMSQRNDQITVRNVVNSPRLMRVGAAQLQRGMKPTHAGRLLTFGSFKLLVAKSGLDVNEEGLEKSYAALLELCKRNHYSWTRIKLKMKKTTAAQTRGTKTQVERLPLTIRDWQRII